MVSVPCRHPSPLVSRKTQPTIWPTAGVGLAVAVAVRVGVAVGDGVYVRVAVAVARRRRCPRRSWRRSRVGVSAGCPGHVAVAASACWWVWPCASRWPSVSVKRLRWRRRGRRVEWCAVGVSVRVAVGVAVGSGWRSPSACGLPWPWCRRGGSGCRGRGRRGRRIVVHRVVVQPHGQPQARPRLRGRIADRGPGRRGGVVPARLVRPIQVEVVDAPMPDDQRGVPAGVQPLPDRPRRIVFAPDVAARAAVDPITADLGEAVGHPGVDAEARAAGRVRRAEAPLDLHVPGRPGDAGALDHRVLGRVAERAQLQIAVGHQHAGVGRLAHDVPALEVARGVEVGAEDLPPAARPLLQRRGPDRPARRGRPGRLGQIAPEHGQDHQQAQDARQAQVAHGMPLTAAGARNARRARRRRSSRRSACRPCPRREPGRPQPVGRQRIGGQAALDDRAGSSVTVAVTGALHTPHSADGSAPTSGPP